MSNTIDLITNSIGKDVFDSNFTPGLFLKYLLYEYLLENVDSNLCYRLFCENSEQGLRLDSSIANFAINKIRKTVKMQPTEMRNLNKEKRKFVYNYKKSIYKN